MWIIDVKLILQIPLLIINLYNCCINIILTYLFHLGRGKHKIAKKKQSTKNEKQIKLCQYNKNWSNSSTLNPYIIRGKVYLLFKYVFAETSYNKFDDKHQGVNFVSINP